MIKECVHTGRNVEEAINAAIEKLGYPRADIQFEIIDLPKKGFLGFGSQPAKVRVYVEIDDPQPAAVVEAPKKEFNPKAPKRENRGEKPAASAQKAAPAAPKSEAAAASEEEIIIKDCGNKPQVAAAYLKDVLAQMGLAEVEVAVKENNGQAILSLTGDSLGMIIGRRGETLDALQYLTGLVANREEGDYLRVTIDSGNYREKREKTLENLARKLANTAVRTGRSSTLEPMNPYERRIIHSAVATVEGAASSSIGEEPNRRVVISSTNPAARKPRSNGYRGNNNGKRSGPRPEGSRDGGRRYDDRPRKPRPPREEPAAAAPTAATTPTPTRTVPKIEAEDKPLYGKIDL